MGSAKSSTRQAFNNINQNSNSVGKMRIAIVGDVHDQWDAVLDEAALKFLNADVCLFVGDFGNENVQIVQEIANLNHPKAVILGNHDNWWLRQASDIDKPKNRVGRQLKCLGETHVGFSSLSFPELKLTVVGARPFAQGGQLRKNQTEVTNHLYGIKSVEESAYKIVDTVLKVPLDHTIIIMGHNGPTGLGNEEFDICGADFMKGGDWGDEDLEIALDRLREMGRLPSLVTFGHMHEKLRYGGSRRMICMDKNNTTTYLNTAVVPRVTRLSKKQENGTLPTQRHFCVVEIENGIVTSAQNQWIEVNTNGQDVKNYDNQALIRYDSDGKKFIYNAKFDKWDLVWVEEEQQIEQTDLQGVQN